MNDRVKDKLQRLELGMFQSEALQQAAIGRHVLELLQQQQSLTLETLLDSLRQEATSGTPELRRKQAAHLVEHLLALTSRG